jgi:hypothetical protein
VAKHNLDQLAEPIVITIDGKDYEVKKVTTLMLDSITKLTDDDKKDASVVIKQLAMFVGVDSKEFENTDLRKVASALKCIQEDVLGDIGKNVSKAEVK